MRKHKKLVAIFVAVSLLFSNAYASTAQAVSLTNASDRLSSSNTGVLAIHTVTFTTSQDLNVGDYFVVRLPEGQGFGNISTSSIYCPANSTSSAPVVTTAVCTATGLVASGTQTIILSDIKNPDNPGTQNVVIASYSSLGALKESADVSISIISSVQVSASVPATLTFAIAPVATGTGINMSTTTGASATTTMGFGELKTGTSSILAQEIRVTTNAAGGFYVTVAQNQDMTSAGGAKIDAFNNGTPPVSPIPWASPVPDINSSSTWGHFGYTTTDSNLSDGDAYGGGLWSGFSGSSTKEVMYNNGPADGTTPNVGMVIVGYRIEISALQEAGEYSNTITYVVTPAY